MKAPTTTAMAPATWSDDGRSLPRKPMAATTTGVALSASATATAGR